MKKERLARAALFLLPLLPSLLRFGDFFKKQNSLGFNPGF